VHTKLCADTIGVDPKLVLAAFASFTSERWEPIEHLVVQVPPLDDITDFWEGFLQRCWETAEVPIST
jgi:hypothetical protein